MGLRLCLVAVLATFLPGFAVPASASMLISIDKSAQRMSVSVDGSPVYDWPVSTGMPGRETPEGSFRPFRMEAKHFSKEWDDAPMPHSIFFTQVGHAIHGSSHRLGSPASHGCVRISVAHAATLYALVKQEGLPNTQVEITGTEPLAPEPRVAGPGRRADPDLARSAAAERKLRRREWLGDNGSDLYGGEGGYDPLYDNPYLPRRAYPNGYSRSYPDDPYPGWD
jgi:hypothetical protein